MIFYIKHLSFDENRSADVLLTKATSDDILKALIERKTQAFCV